MEKHCTKCGKTLPATREFFYLEKNGKNGLRSQCRNCHQQYRLAHAAKHLVYARQHYYTHYEQYMESKRQYRQTHREEAVAYSRQYNRAHAEQRAAYDRQRKLKNPNKRAAILAIRTATRNGSLIRPIVCSVCHLQRETEAHHYKGYAPEHWLTVIFLCRICHKEAHRVRQATE